MREDIKFQLTRDLFSKYGFIAKDKAEFEKIIFTGTENIESEKDLYKCAHKNVDEFIMRSLSKKGVLNKFIESALKNNRPKDIFRYFNELFITYGYKPFDDDISYISEKEELKKFFNDCIKNHKTEFENDDYRFLKNDFLAKVIEAYSLIYVDEKYSEDSVVTRDIVDDWLVLINKIPLLSPEEEVMYATRYANGDEEAKQSLILHNLRLAVNVAKKYNKKYHDLPFEDLINEANIGLIKAVEKFDVTRGNKLSTYATWWIRQSVKKAIAEKGRAVRIPNQKLDELNKLKSAEKEYNQQFECDPTESELAALTGFTIERIKKLKDIDQSMIYLDKKVNGEDSDDSDLYNFLPSSNIQEEVDEEKSMLERNEIIPKALASLTKRERIIVIHRFGLYGNKECTLEEVGKMIGVTRERIRQIEPDVIAKLHDYIVNYKSIDNSYYHYDDSEIVSGSKLTLGTKLSPTERNPKILQKIENAKKKLLNTNLEAVDFDQFVTKVEIKCNDCDHHWISYINKIPAKCYCPNCKLKEKENKYAKVVRELNSDLTISNVINTTTNIDVHCNRCGTDWKVRIPHLLSRGAKCKTCIRQNKEFVKEMETIADNYSKYEAYIPNYSYNPVETYFLRKNQPKFIKTLNDEISYEDIEILAKNFSKLLYKELADDLTVNDILILLIDKGYASGKKYSDKAISKFLNISIDEINKRRNNLKSFNRLYFEKDPYVRKRTYQTKNRKKGE